VVAAVVVVVVVMVPASGDEQATSSIKSNGMSLGIERRSYDRPLSGLSQ
jgi:hypothetical protein